MGWLRRLYGGLVAEAMCWVGVGGKIIPRIRLTSAKDLVEVEAELGNTTRFPKDHTHTPGAA